MAPAIPLVKRDDSDPSKGVLDPHDINNAGFFFLFALIGVAIVLTGIWFFFWARDGGFYFEERDWDDYKSTVLRRRGPNGTLLSNATRSTKLGGGSVYNKAYDGYDDERTELTESTAMSGITAGPSDIYAREKREEKRRQREAQRRKAKSRTKTNKSSGGGDDDDDKSRLVDEQAEKMAREQLRNYREERPARVGGLNAKADGSEWEGSTNAGASSTLSSGLSSAATATEAASATPAAAPGGRPAAGAGSGSGSGTRPAGGGIRKVYSVADRTTARENERMRAEARKMREEGRMARREQQQQRAITAAGSEASESLLSGSRMTVDDDKDDGGTKSYSHPMPELREHRRREREREREQKRTRRGGYQRGSTRDEELEEEVD